MIVNEIFLFVSYKNMNRRPNQLRISLPQLKRKINKMAITTHIFKNGVSGISIVKRFDQGDAGKPADRILRISDCLQAYRIDLENNEIDPILNTQEATHNQNTKILNYAEVGDIQMYFLTAGGVYVMKNGAFCGKIGVNFKGNFGNEITGSLLNTQRNVITTQSYVYFLNWTLELLRIDVNKLSEVIENRQDAKYYFCEVVFSQPSLDTTDFTLLNHRGDYRDIFMLSRAGIIVNITNRPNKRAERRCDMITSPEHYRKTICSCIISYQEHHRANSRQGRKSKPKLVAVQFSIDSKNEYVQIYRLILGGDYMGVVSSLTLKPQTKTNGSKPNTNLVHSLSHVECLGVHYIIGMHSQFTLDVIADHNDELLVVSSGFTVSDCLHHSVYTYIDDEVVHRRSGWVPGRRAKIHAIIGCANGLYDVCIKGI